MFTSTTFSDRQMKDKTGNEIDYKSKIKKLLETIDDTGREIYFLGAFVEGYLTKILTSQI